MLAMYKKELACYLRNVSGFVYAAFTLLVIGIYTFAISLSSASSHFEYVYYNCSFIFLIAVPILTMRAIAEERRQKTDQLLYSLPVSTTQIVLGKYFAMLTVFAVPVFVTCLYPLFLRAFDPSGLLSYSAIYTAVLAFLFLGAALLAIGMFMSSLTENQIISAILSFAVMLICYLMSQLKDMMPATSGAAMIGLAVIILLLAVLVWFLTRNITAAWLLCLILEVPIIVIMLVKHELLEGLLPKVFGTLSVFERFYVFANGIFDFKALIYFASIAFLFVFFTVQSMEKRRWS